MKAMAPRAIPFTHWWRSLPIVLTCAVTPAFAQTVEPRALPSAPVAPAPPAPPNATIGASSDNALMNQDPSVDPAALPGGATPMADVDMGAEGQDGPTAGTPSPQNGDPPEQVGRFRAVEGNVFVASEATSGQPQAALKNRPLTAHDAVTTASDGYAELSVQAGYVWVAPNTRVHVVRIDGAGALIRLHQGTVAFVAQGDGPPIEFELPGDVSVRAKVGMARIDVPDSGDSHIETRDRASVVVQRNGVDQRLGANARLSLLGDSKPERVTTAPSDPFATWVQARASLRAPLLTQTKQSETLRHVSAAMPGYEDLADNGRWRSTPEYGAIWQPTNIASGWAPYRYGHWTFILPWGWTWVDDASWGFAPFHYGRWIYWQNAWAWAPGPFWARPVYAPHLVAWGGGAAGFVSWYPLGFGMSWWPAYPCSYGYAQQLNRPYAHVGPGQFGGGYGGPHGLGRPQPYAITQVSGAAFTAGAHTGGQLRPFGPGAAATTWGFHPPAAPPHAANAWAAQQQGWRAPGYGTGNAPRGSMPYGGTYGRPGVVSPAYRSPYTHPAYTHEPHFGAGPGPMRPLGGNWIHMHNGGVVRPGAGYPGSIGGGWGHGGSMPGPHMGIGPGGHGGHR